MQHETDDPRIEVLHYSSTARKIVSYSFWVSMIGHIEEADTDKSIIVLKDGAKLSVSLSYAALVAKIDEGRSPLDLKPYCKAVLPSVIGEKMEDGAVYAGFSPNTQQPMYAAPADEPGKMTFQEAVDCAITRSKMTGQAYRLPSKKELKALFNNRAAIGGFSSREGDWYCADGSGFPCQRFTDGMESTAGDTYSFAVRLVRS